MAKTKKDTTFLVSSAGTGCNYSFLRNRKKVKGAQKLTLRKYDPRLRKHVEFTEKKLSSLKKKFNREEVLAGLEG